MSAPTAPNNSESSLPDDERVTPPSSARRRYYSIQPVTTPVRSLEQHSAPAVAATSASSASSVAPAATVVSAASVAPAASVVPAATPAPADPFLRDKTEDDDGYDPYSDRPPAPEPLFQEDPWR